jgi:hypothetical protein
VPGDHQWPTSAHSVTLVAFAFAHKPSHLGRAVARQVAQALADIAQQHSAVLRGWLGKPKPKPKRWLGKPKPKPKRRLGKPKPKRTSACLSGINGVPFRDLYDESSAHSARLLRRERG